MNQQKHWKVWSTFARNRCVLSRHQRLLLKMMEPIQRAHLILNLYSMPMLNVPLRFIISARKILHPVEWRKWTEIKYIENQNIWLILYYSNWTGITLVIHLWHQKLFIVNGVSINCSVFLRIVLHQAYLRTKSWRIVQTEIHYQLWSIVWWRKGKKVNRIIRKWFFVFLIYKLKLQIRNSLTQLYALLIIIRTAHMGWEH